MEKIKNLVLNQWNNISVKANIDEKPEDIRLAIKYEDHGDEFLFIETYSGEKFVYGYWLNRGGGGHPNSWDETSWSWMNFIRRPMTYKKIDEKMRKAADISNKIYHEVELRMKERVYNGWGSEYKLEKINDKNYAERIFYDFVKYLDELYADEWFYHSGQESTVKDFLELNEIDTPENLAILEAAHFSSKFNGVDGIAGKAPFKKDYLEGDSVIFIYKDGVELDKSTLLYSSGDPDEWGCSTHYLPLDQFDDNASEKIKNDCIFKIESLIGSLNSIKENINEFDLRSFVNIRDALENVEYEMDRQMWMFEEEVR